MHGVYQRSAKGTTQDSMSLMAILESDLETGRFKSPDSFIRKFGGSKLMRWGYCVTYMLEPAGRCALLH